jgi:hypothetical protein
MEKPPFQFSLTALLLTVTMVAAIAWGIDSNQSSWQSAFLQPFAVVAALVWVWVAMAHKGWRKASMIGMAASASLWAIVFKCSPALCESPYIIYAFILSAFGCGFVAAGLHWLVLSRRLLIHPSERKA